MAMTKKEQAAMQAAIDRCETMAALRWTEPVVRDVPPPTEFDGYSEGWDYNTHSREVWAAWSGRNSHGRGPAPRPDQRVYSGSQGRQALYSTRQRALRALRYDMEHAAAVSLLQIDRLIQQAE